MKQFLNIHDVPNVDALVDSAIRMKSDPLAFQHIGKGKTMVLVFLNPSLRTRLSTQKAAMNLGMNCIVLNAGQDGWKLEFEDGSIMNADKAEHIREAAAVISQYADVIGIRTFAGLEDKTADYREDVLSAFVKYATVPVINLESAIVHPLQSLTDLVTIKEQCPDRKPKVVLTWAPHPRALPQAVANSFLEWMNQADVDLAITHPKGYDLSVNYAHSTPVFYNQEAAFKGADFIYAKNWSSYEDYGQVMSSDPSWMITPEKMQLTNNGHFMHCLPVRRNVVVHDGVLNSDQSLVIQQAANREWAAQAVLKEVLSGLYAR